MSELISIGILLGLAVWGYGCHVAGKDRTKKIDESGRRAKRQTAFSLPIAFLIFAVTASVGFGQSATKAASLDAEQQKSRSMITRQSLAALHSLRFEATADGSGMVSRSERRSLRVYPGGSVEIQSSVSGKPVQIEIHLDGSNPKSAVNGSQALPSHSNYFLGRDTTKWRSGVTQFEQARVDSVYPGIDLLYYGNGESLEHDYQVTPGADPALIHMRIGGTVPRIDDASGDLVVSQADPSTELLRIHKPVAYQLRSDGSRGLVAAAYQRDKDGSFSFALGDYDHSRPLVIDPVITYSTYFGGTNNDGINDVKVDAVGNIYLLVQTTSVDLPVISQISGACPGACGPANPGITSTDQPLYDFYLAKLDPTGQKLLYSTYIGGSQSDIPGELVIAIDGTLYISGETLSPDFPVVNQYSDQQAPLAYNQQPRSTTTLTRLSADGSKILYSTLIGGGLTSVLGYGAYANYGSQTPTGLGGAPGSLVVAPNGIAYLLGTADIPNNGNPEGNFVDAKNASFLAGNGSYIAKFDTTKVGADSLIYARPFGGPGDDVGEQLSSIAIDSKQNLWVFGNASIATPPTPTPDAVQPSCGTAGVVSCGNTFLFELDPDGFMTYATFLGGTITSYGGPPIESPGDMFIDSADNIYVSGKTESIDYPTKNAAYTYATTDGTHGYGFLTKLSPGGQSILYSTYFPWIYPVITANADGLVAAAGTVSNGFPVVNGLNSVIDSGATTDAVIELVDTTKSGADSLLSSGYLGSGGASAEAVTFDAEQNLLLAGSVYGTLPVVGAYQSTCSAGCVSGSDGFLSRLQYQVGKLMLTPSTEAFPNTNLGSTSAALTATLTNGTAQSITLSTPSLTNPTDFTATDNCNGGLASGASCTVTFTFKPSVPGSLASTYSIGDASQPGSPLTVQLSGTGTASAPTVTPASLSFGNVTVGATSPAQAVTVTNTATVPLTFTSVGLTGSGFSTRAAGTTCQPGAALAAHASCTLSIIFSPSTAGAVSGSLTISLPSGFEISSLAVSTSGTGIAAPPTATLTPATYNFGSVAVGSMTTPVSFTLTNTGNADLTTGLVTDSNSVNFLPNSGCNATVAPGASCTIEIEFQPTAAGLQAATLSIVTSAGIKTVALTGTGVASSFGFISGFTSAGLTLNGAAALSGSVLQLTANQPSQASSAFYPTPVSTASFSTDLEFQLLDPLAEGITFTIQGDGPTAIGDSGGGLGYQGIAKSIALKFDLADTNGEGVDSTGIYLDGAAPTVPATSLAASGIDLHSGDVFALHVSYDGTTESITLMDTATDAIWTTQVAENIPAIVGSNQAYFGFTASTGVTAAASVKTAAATTAAAAAITNVGTTANILYWTYAAQSDGVAALQPIQLNFGNVTIGSTSALQTANLTNTGTAQFQVSSITQSDPAIVVHTSFCARPVTPGTYCKLEVTVAPTAAGAFTGSVVINYHLGDGSTAAQNFTSTLAVTATGIASDVSLTPASADFGSIANGQTSSPQTFTVTNNSTTAVTLSQLTIAGAFQIASGATCIYGAQLPAGQSCTIPVAFVPVLGGANSGTLYVSYIGASGRAVTMTSSLTGTGIAPATPTAILTPSSLDFGNVTVGLTSPEKVFTLINISSVTIGTRVGAAGYSGSGFIFGQGGTCANVTSLAPGQSCTISVSFSPLAAGAFSVTFTLSLTQGSSSINVGGTLTGTATGSLPKATLTPSTVDFGNVAIGARSAEKTLTLTNTSTAVSVATANAGAIYLGEAPSGFSSDPGGTCANVIILAPGQFCTFLVSFAPTNLGASSATASVNYVQTSYVVSASATLTGTGTARILPTATLTPSSLDFGNVAIGAKSPEKALTLTNNSTLPFSTADTGAIYLGLTPIGFSSDPGGTCGNVISLAPGQSCTFLVSFTPTTLGTSSATASINYLQTFNVVSASATLTGTGTARILPTATLSPSSLDFGNVAIGAKSPEKALTLTNNSTLTFATVDAGEIYLGEAPSGFSSDQGGTCANVISLAPGQSCTFLVSFSPTTLGASSATASINYLQTFNVVSASATLTGTGTARILPTATLSPSSLDFGNVAVGAKSSEKALTLTNNSTLTFATANAGAIYLGEAPSGFSSDQGGTCANVTGLAPGQSCTFLVSFSPTTLGASSATASVNYAQTFNVVSASATLTGTGIAAPTPTASLAPSPLDFSNVAFGVKSAEKALILTNTSTVAFSISGTEINLSSTTVGFTLEQGGTCANLTILAPGQSCTYFFSFTPTALGASSVTVSTSFYQTAFVVVTRATLTGTGVVTSPISPEIDFGTGFTADALMLSGPTTVVNGALQLTSGTSSAASSAFYPTPVPTASFNTNFTFQLLDPTAEGITFTIQNDSPTAVGSGGGGLGYQGIAKSIAMKFDLKDTAGEGTDSTGVYIDGAAPTVPATSLASAGIDLHSGHVFNLALSYDGKILTMNLTDTVTNAVFTTQVNEDIPTIVGSNVAYFGFTAGSGSPTLTSNAAEAGRVIERSAITASVSAQPAATSNILTWTYVAGNNTGTAQTINFPSLPGAEYGVAPMKLAATASSGLPVSYTVTGPAKVSGSTLTITGVGAVTVTATQSGNATFAPAAPVEMIVDVVKAQLTVTANSLLRNYGAANPSLTYTITGFVDGDTAAVVGGNAALSTTAAATSPAGQYPITFTTDALTAANYEFSYLPGTLTILPAGASCNVIDYSKGFTPTNLSLNGSAKVANGILELTDGGQFEAGSAYFSTPVPANTFTTDVTFQLVNPNADGVTFVVQAAGPHALGGSGGGLGYAGIPRSVALKLDLHNNAGEGADSTGSYINGAFPSQPSISFNGSGIDLHSGHIFHLHLVYDGRITTATLTDTVTHILSTQEFPGNIAEAIGSSSAYFGFTAGTGAQTAIQNILTWTYAGGSACPIEPQTSK